MDRPELQWPPHGVTDDELARIRIAARTHLLRGGAVFPNDGDPSLDDAIAALRQRRTPRAEAIFEDILEHALPLKQQHDENQAVDTAAVGYAWAFADAGYLFGVCIGLEMASLTMCGELPNVRRRTGKAGVR